MFKKILLTTLFFTLFLSVESFAQGLPGGGPPCPNPPCGPPGRPIDGGLVFLLAIGVAYGAKKLKKED